MNSCILAHNAASCEFREYLSDGDPKENKIDLNEELRVLGMHKAAWNQLVALLLIHMLDLIRQLFNS